MKKSRVSFAEDPAVARVREQALRIASKPKAVRKRKDREPRICACGCGQLTNGGAWRAGHNGKKLSQLVREIRAQEVA